MIYGFQAEVKWTVYCSVCKEGVGAEHHTQLHGEPALKPSLPEGWVLVNHRLICPKHEIKLLIDGEDCFGNFR